MISTDLREHFDIVAKRPAKVRSFVGFNIGSRYWTGDGGFARKVQRNMVKSARSGQKRRKRLEAIDADRRAAQAKRPFAVSRRRGGPIAMMVAAALTALGK